MESSKASESKFRKNSEENGISLGDVVKNLVVISLPHLALIVIFVVYILVGAAILKEIENDQTLHSLDGIKIVPQESSILAKVKEQNKIYTSNCQSFNEKLNLFIEESLNTELNIEKSQDDQLESQSIKFIYSLNKKQKNKLNATDVFKTIAQHLIQFKKQLKRDLEFNLKLFMTDFSLKQNEISNNINILIDENLPNFESTRQSKTLAEKIHKNEQKRIFEWNLRQSIYFIGSLVTTLGKF